jgi:hypothetical protein
MQRCKYPRTARRKSIVRTRTRECQFSFFGALQMVQTALKERARREYATKTQVDAHVVSTSTALGTTHYTLLLQPTKLSLAANLEGTELTLCCRTCKIGLLQLTYAQCSSNVMQRANAAFTTAPTHCSTTRSALALVLLAYSAMSNVFSPDSEYREIRFTHVYDSSMT